MAESRTFFVSHGSPMLAVEPGATGDFWKKLGHDLPRPQSVLAVSAHWTTREPTVNAAPKNETIHDFYGFPAALSRVHYEAPGAPALADRVVSLIETARIPVRVDATRGLDHGAWVPLQNMYPAADVPVAQLSVQPQRDARWHMQLGAALRPLADEGVLVLATGGAVHNLREMARDGGPVPSWAKAFDDWLAATLAAGKETEFLDWETAAPEARRAQPTPEHFVPIFIAYGAAGAHPKATRINQGFTLGSMSMAAYEFAA